MEHDEKLRMVSRMKRFGGSFVRALSECFLLADSFNLDRLSMAFPEIVESYGDHGDFVSFYKSGLKD